MTRGGGGGHSTGRFPVKTSPLGLLSQKIRPTPSISRVSSHPTGCDELLIALGTDDLGIIVKTTDVGSSVRALAPTPVLNYLSRMWANHFTPLGFYVLVSCCRSYNRDSCESKSDTITCCMKAL